MQIGSLRDILGWSGTIPQHGLMGVTRPTSFRVLVVPDHRLGNCGAVQLAICRVPVALGEAHKTLGKGVAECNTRQRTLGTS